MHVHVHTHTHTSKTSASGGVAFGRANCLPGRRRCNCSAFPSPTCPPSPTASPSLTPLILHVPPPPPVPLPLENDEYRGSDDDTGPQTSRCGGGVRLRFMSSGPLRPPKGYPDRIAPGSGPPRRWGNLPPVGPPRPAGSAPLPAPTRPAADPTPGLPRFCDGSPAAVGRPCLVCMLCLSPLQWTSPVITPPAATAASDCMAPGRGRGAVVRILDAPGGCCAPPESDSPIVESPLLPPPTRSP